MFNLNGELLVWHATPLPAREAIEQGGIAIINEAVFVGLHPGIPTGLFEHHCKEGYVISLLALPHDEWQWGWDGTYELSLKEGYLRQPVPRRNMVETVDSGEAMRRQLLRTADGGTLGAHGGWLRGYHGWLDEHSLVAQCDGLLRDSSRPQQQLLACAYLSFASAQSRQNIPPLTGVLSTVLTSALPFPESAVQLAVEVWMQEDTLWASHLAAALTPELPFARICQLWAWVYATGDAGVCREFREKMPAWHRRLDELATLMALSPHDYGATITFAAPDAALAQVLVTILTHAPMHNARAMAGIRALEAFPEPLADAALLELLRRNRFVPTRARRFVHQALAPRAARLQQDLQAIAAQYPGGQIRSAAENIMRFAQIP